MQNKYLAWAGVILAAIILIAGGYYFSYKQPEPGFTGTRENVTICYLNFSNSALITIADVQGFFLQEGLDVTLKRFPSGRMALDSLFKDECSIALTSETPVVVSSFDRKDFSIFTMIATSDNNNKVIARSDMGILKPGDLRGKRIATQQGSASFFFLQVFLAKNGISVDNVTILFRDAEELPQALARGEINAFVQGEPHIRRTKQLLGDKTVIFAEPGLSIITVDLVAFNTYIKDRPQVIDRTLLALIQAEEYIKKYPDETIKTLSQKYGIDEPEMSAIMNQTSFTVSLDMSIVFTLEDRARWMIKNNQTNTTIVPNYLDYIYMDSLERIKPEAVTIIH